MKTCKLKRIVVGIMLVILTLGFCVVGTGAARPDSTGQPPMGQPGGFGRGPGFGGQSGFDGETPPELPDGESMSEDDGCFSGRGGRFGSDGQTPPDGEFSRGDQNGFGGRGGHGRDGGFGPMDRDTRAAVEALEDGETKTELLKLLDNVHIAMEALREADDDSRESAEAAVKEARDALNTALAAAGIETAMEEPPEKPEGDNGMTPPELPDGGFGMTPPEPPENTTI